MSMGDSVLLTPLSSSLDEGSVDSCASTPLTPSVWRDTDDADRTVYTPKSSSSLGVVLTMEKNIARQEEESEENPSVDAKKLDELKEYLTSPKVEQDAMGCMGDENGNIDFTDHSPFSIKANRGMKTSVDDFLGSFRVVNLDLAYEYGEDGDVMEDTSNRRATKPKGVLNKIKFDESPLSTRQGLNKAKTVSGDVNDNPSDSNNNANTIYGNVTAETVKMLADER